MNIANECSSTCFYVNRAPNNKPTPSRKTVRNINHFTTESNSRFTCTHSRESVNGISLNFAAACVYRKICRNRRNQLCDISIWEKVVRYTSAWMVCVCVCKFIVWNLFFFGGQTKENVGNSEQEHLGWLLVLSANMNPGNQSMRFDTMTRQQKWQHEVLNVRACVCMRSHFMCTSGYVRWPREQKIAFNILMALDLSLFMINSNVLTIMKSWMCAFFVCCFANMSRACVCTRGGGSMFRMALHVRMRFGFEIDHMLWMVPCVHVCVYFVHILNTRCKQLAHTKWWKSVRRCISAGCVSVRAWVGICGLAKGEREKNYETNIILAIVSWYEHEKNVFIMLWLEWVCNKRHTRNLGYIPRVIHHVCLHRSEYHYRTHRTIPNC